MLTNDVCPKEKTAQSKVNPNPGPIKDDETLARMVIHPHHVNSDNCVDAKFIQVKELKNGCSFDRKDICGENDIRRRGIEKEKNITRKSPESPIRYLGYMEIKTETIRNIHDDKKIRGFCVLDDATEDNKAHAIVEISINMIWGKIRLLRNELLKKMNRNVIE